MNNVRQPVVAGAFYESSAATLRLQAQRMLSAVELPENLPARLYGGLVPHAGWVYSGRLAAETFSALSQARPLGTVVLLGADHTGVASGGEVYDSGVWQTPLGQVMIDTEVAAALLAANPMLRPNPQAHSREHSLEVQVPLMQSIEPKVRIVPITMPPTDAAVEIGAAIGQVLAANFPEAMVVGSTDLTHHGGHFGSPGGRGGAGEEWTTANDRRILDLIEAMDAAGVIREAAGRHNACGAGAIAGTIAASQQRGATRAIVLEYTNSYRVVHARYPDDPDDTTVGYASVVFG